MEIAKEYCPECGKGEWVGLTDEDIEGCKWLLSADKEYEQYTGQEYLVVEGVNNFVEAIVNKLKEKNANPIN